MCLICRHNYCNNTTQSEPQKPHFLHGCGARPCPSLWEEEVGTALSWQVELEPLSSVLTLYNQNTRVCLVVLGLCLSPTSTPPCHSIPLSHCRSALSNVGPIFPLPLALPAAPFPLACFSCTFSSRAQHGPSPPAPHCPDLLASLHPSSCSCPCPGSPLPKHPNSFLRPITLQSLAYLHTRVQAVASLISSLQQL